MKKYWIIALVLVLLIVVIGPLNSNRKSEVCFDGACFEVEIVADDEARQRGLMHRESLDSNRGMFFIFERESLYSFWMKSLILKSKSPTDLK